VRSEDERRWPTTFALTVKTWVEGSKGGKTMVRSANFPPPLSKGAAGVLFAEQPSPLHAALLSSVDVMFQVRQVVGGASRGA